MGLTSGGTVPTNTLNLPVGTSCRHAPQSGDIFECQREDGEPWKRRYTWLMVWQMTEVELPRGVLNGKAFDIASGNPMFPSDTCAEIAAPLKTQ